MTKFGLFAIFSLIFDAFLVFIVSISRKEMTKDNRISHVLRLGGNGHSHNSNKSMKPIINKATKKMIDFLRGVTPT